MAELDSTNDIVPTQANGTSQNYDMTNDASGKKTSCFRNEPVTRITDVASNRTDNSTFSGGDVMIPQAVREQSVPMTHTHVGETTSAQVRQDQNQVTPQPVSRPQSMSQPQATNPQQYDYVSERPVSYGMPYDTRTGGNFMQAYEPSGKSQATVPHPTQAQVRQPQGQAYGTQPFASSYGASNTSASNMGRPTSVSYDYGANQSYQGADAGTYGTRQPHQTSQSWQGQAQQWRKPSWQPQMTHDAYGQSHADNGYAGAGVTYATRPTQGMPVPPNVPVPVPSKSSDKKEDEKAHKGMSPLLTVLIAAATSVACFCGGMAVTGGFGTNGDGSSAGVIVGGGNTQIDTSGATNEDGDGNLANRVAKAATPAVVSIYTYEQESNGYYDLFGLRGYSGSDDSNVQETLTGLGSGVIIRKDGYIITNYHVVSGASSLKVEANDNEYDGKVVGYDETSDIAVVKIDADNLTAITVADSSQLEVGDWTMAIGSPRGYENTCTTGIVSALGRSTAAQSVSGVTIYANLIQTDASINEGNSGGALVDDQARLIGINALISTDSGDSAGIGFAIPSNYAINIANQIIENGSVKHAQLGVTLEQSDTSDGAIVRSVTNGSAADDAGLKKGDVITELGGEKIETASDLVYAVMGHLVGDNVHVIYERDGSQMESDITLSSD